MKSNHFNWASFGATKTLLGGVLLFATVSQAQSTVDLFQITNRRYGNLTLDAQKAVIDSVFDDLEDLVNSAIPSNTITQGLVDGSSATTLMKGFADASTQSFIGNGVDYASDFKWGLLGGTSGVGVDLGSTGISDIISGGPDGLFNSGAGVGLQGAIVAGVHGRALKLPKLGPIDFNRARFFISFFKFSRTFNEITASSTSFALNGQYYLYQPRSVGFGAAKWGGILLGTGLRYAGASINGEFPGIDFQSGGTQASLPGSPSVIASFEGSVNAGVDMKTFQIPVEVVTSGRLLWIINAYTGLGTALNFGSAKTTSGLSGNVEVTSTPNVLGDIGGDADAPISGTGKPRVADLYVLQGFQFELYALAFNVGMSKSLLGNTYGVNAGARAFF